MLVLIFFCLIGCGVFTSMFKIGGEIFIWHFAGFTGIDDPYEPPLNCEVCVPVNGDTSYMNVLQA